MTLRRLRARWGSAVLGLVACGPAIEVDSTTDADSEDSTGSSATASTAATDWSTTATTGGTDGPTTSNPGTTDPATTDPATTDPATTDPVTTDPSTAEVTGDPTGGDLPDGSTCASGDECISGECYVLGILGGICGECDEDADCDGGGCTLPNPLAQPPNPSLCNDGSYGDGCETDDVCGDELLCALIIDVPGILAVSTCSECATHLDCADGFTCEPDIAVQALAGVKRCVANGTLANGQTCDFTENGDAACASGICTPADVMGVVQIGVCSACEVDADCMQPLTCEPAQIDLMGGVTPGMCVP